MSGQIKKVLVVGGGFSGMSAAIQFRKQGIDVDLVEIDPDWRNYGAGISIGGATLRAFKTLGILDRYIEVGYLCDGVDVCHEDGECVAHIPTPRIAGPDVAGSGAVMRPALASILADETRAVGVNVSLGCTVESLHQDNRGVDVELSDGTKKRYDLIVGADGLYSQMRDLILPGADRPAYSGQGVWRAVLPRAMDLARTTLWNGFGLKVGLNPVSASEMYLFVNEIRPTNSYIEPAMFLAQLKGLLSQFSAPMLQRVSLIVYRPLEGLLVPSPWYCGRVVLIGDAVHATTPHLASGACIGIEDAIVLAEEIAGCDDAEKALECFQSRRWERCRMVVENSARLGEIEMTKGDMREHGEIMTRSFAALAQPI